MSTEEVKRRVRLSTEEATALAGLVILCAGIAALCWPAALIVFGAAFVAAGTFLNLGGRR